MNFRQNLGLAISGALVASPLVAVLVVGTSPDADAAAGSPRRDRTPICKYEDGSGQSRCVWDAAHSGNGRGHSFLAIHGGTDRERYIYISHKKAHRYATTSA